MSLYEENILEDEKALARFWEKVEANLEDPNACWNWNAKKDKNGCGIFCLHCPQLVGNKYTWKSFRAPRLMWILEHDQPIPTNLQVLHSCDHECCTNPRHLKLGTPKDNMQDRKARGRYDTNPKGEEHPHAVLTNAKVRKICHLYFVKGVSIAETARRVGTTAATVLPIIQGKAWKHITKTHIPKGFKHKYRRCQIRNEKIYKEFKKGYSYQELAERFKMGLPYLREVVRNKIKEHGDEPTTHAFRSAGRRKTQ